MFGEKQEAANFFRRVFICSVVYGINLDAPRIQNRR
jgi:hypothetical protein